MKDLDIQSTKKRGPVIKAQLFVNEKGIKKVNLLPATSTDSFEYEIIEERPAPHVKDLIEKWLESYCKGRPPKVILPIVLEGLPPYTTRILSILRDLPVGVILTYQQLAEITDNPLGARAVGNACARNPCPLIIPCHRVLAKGGRIGGFSGGIDIKRLLLNFEGVNI
ncbi:MAG: methylated-DNA--[protein]-cysteine S-methyltransferase [Parachlamydiaceae bacterium]|nr:methylated-DNA--[protein]-cysteine S-methyltransferase [Parachlamydiaceae bacterium]